MKRNSLLALALFLIPAALYGQTITSISPTQVIAGSGQFTLTVVGTGFTFNPNSGFRPVVQWNGTTIPTTYISPAQLTATVDAPLVANPGTATITVRNPNGALSNAVQFTIVPLLSIATTDPLPVGTACSLYSRTFTATGGTPPYVNWRILDSSLPPGLSLSSDGVLSGTPTTVGSYTFYVFVDDSGIQGSTFQRASKTFHLTVNATPPTLSITGLSGTMNPAQQPTFNMVTSAAYPLAISGTITLIFTPNAVNPANDPAIQFSTGGRTLNFTISACQTSVVFQPPTPPAAIQTGTVAGTITLTTTFSAGGQGITPPTASVQIARSAPVITSVQVVRTGTGFNVKVIGYSTPRQMTRAEFGFTGAANLQTLSLVVLLDNPTFSTWYAGESSQQFGSQFLYTQPFSVQGDMNAITLVSVTLVNSIGSSQPSTASF